MSSSEESSEEGSDVENNNNTGSDDNSSDGESGSDSNSNSSSGSGSGSDSDTESEDNAPVAAPVASSRKRKITGKGNKDPNAPKKPMSAYILYSNSRRAAVREENPGMKFGQITQTIAAQFRTLEGKEKRIWEKKSTKEKERYRREMANYSAPEESDDNGGGKNKKKKKDPNAPKKALTSYMYFMNRNRASIKEKNPEATFGELARLVAAAFRALTPEQKQKYIDLSTIDKGRYQKQMQNYIPPKGSSVPKKYKDPNKPKRAMTSFMCFANATRPQVKIDQPNLSFGDVGKTLGRLFRELTPEEKDKFIQIANKDKVRYAKAMEVYNRNIEEEKKQQLQQQQQQSDDESGSGSDDGNGSDGTEEGSNSDSGSEDGSDSEDSDSD